MAVGRGRKERAETESRENLREAPAWEHGRPGTDAKRAPQKGGGATA
jgi:hypothetical protein